MISFIFLILKYFLDVSNSTETIAVSYKNNKFKLYGYKWFSSATECEMSLVLARIVDMEQFEKIKDFWEKYEYLRKISVSLFMIKTRKSNFFFYLITYFDLK